jgi:signal transduction histidine kinase
MQQLEQLAQLGEPEQARVDAAVETLAALNRQGEQLAELAHDARNMVTALDLYCDLLREPGVAQQFSHYGGN